MMTGTVHPALAKLLNDKDDQQRADLLRATAACEQADTGMIELFASMPPAVCGEFIEKVSSMARLFTALGGPEGAVGAMLNVSLAKAMESVIARAEEQGTSRDCWHFIVADEDGLSITQDWDDATVMVEAFETREEAEAALPELEEKFAD